MFDLFLDFFHYFNKYVFIIITCKNYAFIYSYIQIYKISRIAFFLSLK